MAKKKSAASNRRTGFGKVRLLPELQKAEAMLLRGQWSQAKQVLENLDQQHPGNPEVLSHLVNTYLDLDDHIGYTYACERLLKADPRNAYAAYGLSGGYMMTMHPLLALQALRNAVERFPNHEQAAESRKRLQELETMMASTLEEMGLEGEEGEAIARLHEQGQVHLERGHYAKARQVEQEVLRLKPDFLAAQNNLSLIYFSESNLDGAIASAQQVLDQQPDNVHALANLIRFYCSLGEWEQAEAFATRLKESQTPAWDVWTKKVEALSYLGDDAGILQVYEQARKADDINSTSALFHHLVAVALERSGQTREARKQWKEALKKSPGMTLAQANLEDLDLPVGQRQGPWAFDLNFWLNREDTLDLITALQNASKTKDDKALSKAAQRYLQDHPAILNLIPVLLDRGDPAAREFALRCATVVQTPEMLQALHDFALSQSGPDSLRHEAIMQVSQADLLPSNKVRMWLQGEWREIMLIAYTFHREPPYEHTPEVEELLSHALDLLRQGKPDAAKTAEQVLQEAIALEPDKPDLLNNLAVSYEIQGRPDEATTLLTQISEQYPDYVHGQIMMARLHLSRGDVDAAEAILKPMLSRKRFHLDDFAEFSDAYIQFLIARKQVEGAKMWLDMWKQVDPEHPKIPVVERSLSALSRFSRLTGWRKK